MEACFMFDHTYSLQALDQKEINSKTLKHSETRETVLLKVHQITVGTASDIIDINNYVTKNENSDDSIPTQCCCCLCHFKEPEAIYHETCVCNCKNYTDEVISQDKSAPVVQGGKDHSSRNAKISTNHGVRQQAGKKLTEKVCDMSTQTVTDEFTESVANVSTERPVCEEPLDGLADILPHEMESCEVDNDFLAEEIQKCISQFNLTDSLVELSPLTTLTKRCQRSSEPAIFKCGECGKNFNYKHHLKVHMKVHIPDKPFSCNLCDKKFSLKHHYTQHIRVHTGEKPYKCKVCDKSFLSSSNLKRHFDTHVLKVVKVDDEMFFEKGEPNHVCEICDKKFNRIDHLKHHLQIHTGELGFKCDICGKEFNRKYHLTRHLKTKCGQKHECPVCKKRYKNKRNFDLHVESHDSDDDFNSEYETSEDDMSDDQREVNERLIKNELSDNIKEELEIVTMKNEPVEEEPVNLNSVKTDVDGVSIKMEKDEKMMEENVLSNEKVKGGNVSSDIIGKNMYHLRSTRKLLKI